MKEISVGSKTYYVKSSQKLHSQTFWSWCVPTHNESQMERFMGFFVWLVKRWVFDVQSEWLNWVKYDA